MISAFFHSLLGVEKIVETLSLCPELDITLHYPYNSLNVARSLASTGPRPKTQTLNPQPRKAGVRVEALLDEGLEGLICSQLLPDHLSFPSTLTDIQCVAQGAQRLFAVT